MLQTQQQQTDDPAMVAAQQIVTLLIDDQVINDLVAAEIICRRLADIVRTAYLSGGAPR